MTAFKPGTHGLRRLQLTVDYSLDLELKQEDWCRRPALCCRVTCVKRLDCDGQDGPVIHDSKDYHRYACIRFGTSSHLRKDLHARLTYPTSERGASTVAPLRVCDTHSREGPCR